MADQQPYSYQALATQQGGYQPQQGGNPPQQGGYCPQQGSYTPQQGRYQQQEVAPSAPPDDEMNDEPPPPSYFECVSGYETASGFDSVGAGPPPPYVPQDQPEERPEENFSQVDQITDLQAKEALIDFVAEHCCYGTKPAVEVDINSMQGSTAFHYKLESFIETRTFNWHQEPYFGQPIDGPENGPAPHAWQMQVTQPAAFQPTVIYKEIPHTATVKICPRCKGKGRIKCKRCHGQGHYRSGDNTTTCSKCHGRGKVRCPICDKQGKLKTYLRLRVEWEIKQNDHVLERTDLPNNLIKYVSGTVLFAQELPRVFPVSSFHEQEINLASLEIVNKHATFASKSLIHRQRHDLRAVPVNEIHCVWKDKPYRFWVYGMEHKVHCPDYPQQCCCGCTIL